MYRLQTIVTAIAGSVALSIFVGCNVAVAGTLVIEGQAHVVDNATIEIWGHRIVLMGIVVPDAKSKAGLEGRKYLERLVASVAVRCLTSGPSFSVDMRGQCFAGKVDIGASLVQLGYARQLGQPSNGR